MKTRPKICAVLTVYNRRQKTLNTLKSFFKSGDGFDLTAVLMDDGSTDGTADAVCAEFPEVAVLRGSGALYWNRGMAQAFQQACRCGADYYLWLNDDTELYPQAVAMLLEDAQSIDNPHGCIIIGSLKDPTTGLLTYGGVRCNSRWHAGSFERIAPQDEIQPCDAMNGNVVLVSAAAAQVTGAIDVRFSHSMGDYDYGLRAVRAGVTVVSGHGFHGECPRNPWGTLWYESRSLRERCKRVNTPKGLPMKEWAYFLRKHGGASWPLAWLMTYRRILTGS